MSNVARTGDDDINNATSSTNFGRSVESQAQMRDAGLSSNEVSETLNIYRVEPVARPDDPRWSNVSNHGALTVAARTAGDARIVAASRELDFMDIDAAPAEGVTTANASPFRDEKLYTVREIEHGRTDLERGVVEGEVSVNTIKPVQED